MDDFTDKIKVTNHGNYVFVTVIRKSKGLTVRHAVNAGRPNNAGVAKAHAQAVEFVARDWAALT